MPAFPPPPSETSYLSDDDPVDRRRTMIAEMPVVVANIPKKNKQQTPQEAIDEFWGKFTTKAPGKATTVIPSNAYAERAAKRSSKAIGTSTQASYEEAAAVCKAKVEKIVKECRRVNQKYRDPHFDLEFDLKWGGRDTLESLCNVKDPKPSEFKPKSVKRVVDIFDNPKFYIDGPTANDVRQGRDGDCWLLAALCTLSNKPSLIERCCVARDEQVGVYGFVFHRDGEWISEIIDDKLFLTKPDFDESFLERMLWEDRERVNSEEQYRKAYQSGSGALYFAQCEHADETWLPLLEKAYAKSHGDYSALEGGFTGEGIEDLTGGVTSELYIADILDREYFWKEELMKVNDEFLFGCSTGMWGLGWGERKGIVELHAYSVMKAVEMDGQRLVLLKNPWGKGEWKGAWSDGSKEWTAEWLTKLDHRFGDDGAFWISYQDLLRKYQAFDRTRLFGPEWKVTSLWTTVSVPWTLDYHDTQFAFSISQTGPVVLVLSQLDDRYYRGLEGQYNFELNFRLHKSGQEDYVVRTISPYCQDRSVNVELELEAGEYTVLLKINATRNMDLLPIETVVRNNARDRRDKLIAVGMSYDLAHSKGKIVETEEEKKTRKDAENRKKEKEKRELKKKMMEVKRRRHYMQVKEQTKRREKKAKAKAKQQAKKAERAERSKAKKLAAEQRVAAAASQRPVEVGEGQDGPVREDKSTEAGKEKHVTILTPRPSPNPDDTKSEWIAKEGESSNEPSIGTPSTSSVSSSSADRQEAQPTKEDIESPPGEMKTSETTNPQSAPIQESIPGTYPDSQPPEESTSPSAPAEGTSDVLPTIEPMETAKASNDKDLESRAGSDVPEAVTNPSVMAAPEEVLESEDDESLYDSDISSVSDISDREVEMMMTGRANAPAPPPRPPLQKNVPEEQDEFERNPWNAVATVGLRVYYKVADGDRDKEIVKLWVVRPNAYAKKDEEDEDSDDADGKKKAEKKNSDGSKDEDAKKDQVDVQDGENEKGLDVDDSSKDATLVGDSERRKKSIVPSGDGAGDA